MKDFTYVGKQHSLFHEDCIWLDYMGLYETRWILDTEWIIFSYDMTYSEWMKTR